MSVPVESDVSHSIVKYSLRRSNIRRKILLYLDKAGKEVSIKDISKALDYCYSTTYGAMIGNGAHHSRSFALQSLGLVERKGVKGNCFFLLTDKGRNEARLIKKEGGSID